MTAPPVPPEATAAPARWEMKYREKVAFLLGAALLVLAAHGVDLVQAGGPNWPALGIRVVWFLLLVGQAAALRWGGRTAVIAASVAASLGTAVVY